MDNIIGTESNISQATSVISNLSNLSESASASASSSSAPAPDPGTVAPDLSGAAGEDPPDLDMEDHQFSDSAAGEVSEPELPTQGFLRLDDEFDHHIDK